jgi:hypothetical protein
MAEVTEERIAEAVNNIKAAFADGFQWDDVSTVVGEVVKFAEVFDLSGPEKKALALRVAQRVLDETDIPILPDKLVVPFLGDIGADALLMKAIPSFIDLVVGAANGKLGINKSAE